MEGDVRPRRLLVGGGGRRYTLFLCRGGSVGGRGPMVRMNDREVRSRRPRPSVFWFGSMFLIRNPELTTHAPPAAPTAAPPHAAVVGLQWGDEGKGKAVDLLTDSFDCVIRYNGGANAGHTVVVGDQKYALHLIPSGILSPSKINVIANGVVVDPAKLLEEIDMLATRGVEVGENLRVSDRSHVVMPYHKGEDALREAAIGRAAGDGKKIGTTGRGIGPAYADKACRTTGIRFGELLHPDAFREKLRHIVALKNATMGALARLAEADFEPIDADQLAEQYLGFAEVLRPHVCDTTQLLHEQMAAGKKLLWEGANACMLDIDHGTYPYVTSSNCSSLGIYAGSGVPGGRVGRMIGITKAYTTRVGGGPFPTELDDEDGRRLRERGGEYGTTTGRPRRCGWLDLAALRYAAMVCGATELGIMKLDVLAGFDTLRLCTGYELDGRRIEHFPADAAALERVRPLYEEIGGFTEPVADCRSFDDLPPAARRYIERIEEVAGVPVNLVSVGPERSQTLFRG